MALLDISVVYYALFGIAGLAILVVLLRKRQQGKHNEKMRLIYEVVGERLTDALAAEQISFEDFAVAINGARDIYNESLVGKTDTLKLPHMKVYPSADTGTPTLWYDHAHELKNPGGRQNRSQGKKSPRKGKNPSTR